MRSPLEHDPELVALLGLITVRWSALEDALAELLGRFMRVDHAGHSALFALTSFSQRLELISSVASYSVESKRHADTIARLLKKIGDLWIARNYFVHSHYIHQTVYPNRTTIQMIREDEFALNPDAISTEGEVTVSRSFGYVKRKHDGTEQFVPVNRGTFHNHAVKVHRRGRQVLVVVKALDTQIINLRKDAPVNYVRLSPRSPRYASHVPLGGEVFIYRDIEPR